MNYKAIPLDMIAPPNYYAPLADGRWVITSPNAVTLWFGLQIEDSLGARRYMVATGATMTVTFQRADQFTSSQSILTQTAQSVTLTATVNANDRSLFSMNLTTQNIQTLVSGTVKCRLVEAGVDTTWLQDYGISKKLTNPGF